MRIKQPNGEYLNMYVDRYIDLLTKAKFADSPLAVMHFLGTLLPPVKDCLERRLAEIRAKKNADFILEDDTLRMQEDLPWFEKSGTISVQACRQEGTKANRNEKKVSWRRAEVLSRKQE
ncbi:hypothetical protein G6F55_013942 [Rhizopus delemar]|nr:hypothetical protein G6F55_013942 [Rhizopus delemar]